jgi:uncharacterized membrane protein (DUF485 family)
VRTDPTDNGGLFVGRRPGTAPVRYRALPVRGSATRRRIDETFAAFLLLVMLVVGGSFWGPIPVAWLWVASMLQAETGSVSLALFVGFLGMLLTLLLGLVLMRRIDQTWILVRRAAGHDQREGVMTTIFWVSAAIGAVLFSIWLLVFAGLGPSLAPTE